MSSQNGFGKEIARTTNYVVLSRRRATMLFADLVRRQILLERLQRSNDSLHNALDVEQNLLVHALHELALMRAEKEPQTFIRRWNREHRRKEEARVGA